MTTQSPTPMPTDPIVVQLHDEHQRPYFGIGGAEVTVTLAPTSSVQYRQAVIDNGVREVQSRVLDVRSEAPDAVVFLLARVTLAWTIPTPGMKSTAPLSVPVAETIYRRAPWIADQLMTALHAKAAA